VRVLDFVTMVLKTFGFERYDIYLSTAPPSPRHGRAVETATSALKGALEKRGLPYTVDPGEGVFYGPKIDIKIKDQLDRACSARPSRWTSTIRTASARIHRRRRQGPPARDVHRALLGSLERFFGVLIEHHAGAFPLWLAPVQAVVIPVADAHMNTRARLPTRCGGRIRCSDERAEKMGYKIREAQVQKSPTCSWSGRSKASIPRPARLRAPPHCRRSGLRHTVGRLDPEDRAPHG